VRRGEVYWAILDPRSGSEQGGRRPVVILSNDAFNASPNWHSIIVVPLSTSLSQARRGPTAILIPAGQAGLRQDSVALCHQITTLDRAKLGGYVGRLPAQLLSDVEQGLRVALQFP
jgi:mRNA interferase MazF